MKKAATAKKQTKPPKTVDEYLATVSEPACTTLSKVRSVIRAALPKDATEVISYGIPIFKHNRKMVIGFGAFTNHCSLFAMNGRVQEDFKEELKGYKTSKGTIQFALDKPLPTGLLKKLVKSRVAQNEAKGK
jgi:uncharacterized protein YdhG (YjbR/CyaY superfamily)